MCLAVYLGTNTPLTVSGSVALGGLGIEKASWTPPPLRRNHKYVYFLGRKGEAAKLECSCLLVEHVIWTETGPVITADDLYPEIGPCPFETLRSYCAIATEAGQFATIVCDDNGGADNDCTEECYGDASLVRLEHIARGHLLFADANGGFPWRVMHVVNSR